MSKMVEHFARQRSTATSGKDARDRKLTLPADAVRKRAKQCDASDVDRLRWLLQQRCSSGLFPTWTKALRGAL